MKLSKKQNDLIKDINSVLKKYTKDRYNPDIVLEVLSRAMRKRKRNKKHLKVVADFPVPKARPNEILKEQRRRLGLSINKLVRKTGIAQPNLSAMESGKRSIGVAIAKKLSKALKIDYKALL